MEARRSMLLLKRVAAAVVLPFCFCGATLAQQTNGTAPGAVRNYSTIHSIGIEWDIEGDANHNAACAVEYRQEGRTEWSKAMPLLRIDYRGWYSGTKADRHYNMLAGSIL